VTAVWAEVEPPCTRHDPELFFPDRQLRPGRNSEDDPWVAAARRVCAGCPVRLECLRTALDNREDYGIWGGTTPDERRDMLRSRVA
jgi:WhiB family redox-sensing transcriptional regulator